MLQHLNELFLGILTFSKANPIIASALGLWGLSAVTFFLRDVPSTIYRFIKRQVTTTLDLNSQDRVYHEFLEWLSLNKMHSMVRTININSGRYSAGSYSVSYNSSTKNVSLGYGKTFFTHNKRLYFVSRYKDSANQTEMVKEILTITVFGRSHEALKTLLFDVKKSKEKPKIYTEVYGFSNDSWTYQCSNYKRMPETVIVDKEVEKKLYGSIDNFLSSKDWYVKNGVPYRLGILLSGPPGTGKTSLIKAICAKYERELYTLSLSNISDARFLDAMARTPENCVIAIEDIDAFNLNINREADSKDKLGNVLTISGLLNGLDGVASAENRILIATTNHVSKLDSALLRDGRFDLKLVIGNMSSDTLRRYLSVMYKDFDISLKLPDNVCPATIQRLVFENQTNYHKVLEKL
jgi:mitochondrial chaperone BCS1